MIKKKTINTLCLSGLILITSCSEKTVKEENNVQQHNEAFLKTVKTVEAQKSNQNEELTLSGKVEYDPDKIINYVSLVNGIADRTYFSLGDRVQKGQNLLDVRSSELSSLQSDLVKAESEIKIAERELKTARSMYQDNMLSEKELLEAESKLKQEQADYQKIKNDMNVQGVSKGNGMFSIKAPMSGFVVNKNVSSGSTVSPDSDPLFTIADLSTVWITANVYAGNLLSVKQGMDVDITTLSYPGEIFKGKISAISQVFDPEEKVLKARIVMPNKDLKFKPEMSAVIKLKNEINSQFISIPSDALIFDNDQYFVVVEESQGNYSIKEVILRGHNKKTTYISEGLTEGEKVVINNQLLIYSGLKGN